MALVRRRDQVETFTEEIQELSNLEILRLTLDQGVMILHEVMSLQVLLEILRAMREIKAQDLVNLIQDLNLLREVIEVMKEVTVLEEVRKATIHLRERVVDRLQQDLQVDLQAREVTHLLDLVQEVLQQGHLAEVLLQEHHLAEVRVLRANHHLLLQEEVENN